MKRFNILEAKTIDIPRGTISKQDRDEARCAVNETMYRVIIGSLLYSTTSKHDVVFVMEMCARFHACCKESHLKATKTF